MEQKNVQVENLYKYTDIEKRKTEIISAIVRLIELDLESSMRIEAFAQLQNEKI